MDSSSIWPGSAAMTLFELIYLFSCAGLGVLGWSICSPLGVGGSLLGGILGVLVLPLLACAYQSALTLWTKRVPLYPTCRRGVCSAEQYRILRVDSNETSVECQCGDNYLWRSAGFLRGVDFLEKRKDGSVVPYRSHRFLGSWSRPLGD